MHEQLLLKTREMVCQCLWTEVDPGPRSFRKKCFLASLWREDTSYLFQKQKVNIIKHVISDSLGAVSPPSSFPLPTSWLFKEKVRCSTQLLSNLIRQFCSNSKKWSLSLSDSQTTLLQYFLHWLPILQTFGQKACFCYNPFLSYDVCCLQHPFWVKNRQNRSLTKKGTMRKSQGRNSSQFLQHAKANSSPADLKLAMCVLHA